MTGLVDVFVTVDGNLQYQQKLSEAHHCRGASGGEHRYETLKPLVAKVEASLESNEQNIVVVTASKE